MYLDGITEALKDETTVKLIDFTHKRYSGKKAVGNFVRILYSMLTGDDEQSDMDLGMLPSSSVAGGANLQLFFKSSPETASPEALLARLKEKPWEEHPWL